MSDHHKAEATHAPTVTSYAKRAGAKATVGEAAGLAQGAAYPAVLAARWALALATCAVVVSFLALAVSLWR